MKRCAFTLVELLAGLVLTSLLMVAVSNLLGIVGRRTDTILQSAPDDNWKDVLTERLRWDLDNSSSWRVSPTSLALTGFLGFDPLRNRPTMTLATVTYEIKGNASQTWLIRTCQIFHSLNNQPPTKELICIGIHRFQLLLPASHEPVEQISGGLPKSFELRLLGKAGDPVLNARHFH